MNTRTIDTVVIGAGQAGIAASEHLTAHDIPHIVLEKDRVAEKWRTGRWDSLVANGPAWHDRFPNMVFPETPANGFPGKDEVVRYFEEYAARFDAPIRSGVEVRRVTKDGEHFIVETSKNTYQARHVIAATGPFQKPVVPDLIPSGTVNQIHSADYRNSDALPEGAVMVIGAGSSGVQIAEELARAGRKVFLSVGPHDRPPRSYRGKDFVWWLGVLGKWDMATPCAGREHVTIAVSGANGGHTVDFRNLAKLGITLVGRTENCEGDELRFAGDLAENIRNGDENYLSVLREADTYVADHKLNLPPEPEAHNIGPLPDTATDPIRALHLSDEGISTVIWATGYTQDFSWLQVDGALADGKPLHHRGIGAVDGLYYLGLPWLSRRGSSFIWGVWHDAKFVADHIATS